MHYLPEQERSWDLNLKKGQILTMATKCIASRCKLKEQRIIFILTAIRTRVESVLLGRNLVKNPAAI